MTPADFRSTFPEFSSVTDYPEPFVQFWIDLGGKMLVADRWGDILDYGIGLFVAHHLAIENRDQQAAEIGGIPGEVTGPTASKSVDKVSVTYDAGGVAYEGAGFWNMTSYGIRLAQLFRMVGAGVVQM